MHLLGKLEKENFVFIMYVKSVLHLLNITWTILLCI